MKKYSGIELIEKLCNLFGPSGCEVNVADFIKEQISGKCDSIREDRLGNVIATVSSGKANAPKLMLSAHMDEVGFMITEITDEGYLKFGTVGGIDPKVLSGKRVTVGDEFTRYTGVVNTTAIHHKKRDERLKTVPIQSMFIDIGAASKEEAQKLAPIGSYGTFDSEFYSFGSDNRKIKGKAIDDRLGCAIMIEAMRDIFENKEALSSDLYFCFTVREEIGISGAAVAAQTVSPDFAIVLECTTVADLANVKSNSTVATQGEGGAISLMDRSTIYDRGFTEHALSLAKSKDIPAQIKKAVSGGNDAAHIHKSGAGVRTLALSVPTRYLHSPACVADMNDYLSTLALVKELAKSEYFANTKGASNV